MPVSWQIAPSPSDGEVDVLRDDRQRLRRRASPAGSATSACFIAARTSGGRSVDVWTISCRTLSKNEGSIPQV